MAISFDHINAFLIAGTIFFVVMAYQSRGQSTAINDNVMHITRTQTLDLASLLEQDMIQLARQLEVDSLLFDWPQTKDSNTTALTFYIDHLVEPALTDTLRKAIQYKLVPRDTLDNIPLYELERSTCSSPPGTPCVTWQFEGASAPLLRSFKITPLDTHGAPSLSASNTDFFKLRFSMMSFFTHERSSFKELTWGTTLQIRP